MQNYFYDLHDQLVKSEIFKKDGTKETWAYTYDALGRRIGKGRLKHEEVSGGLEEETRKEATYCRKSNWMVDIHTSIGNNIVKEQIVQTILKKVLRSSEKRKPRACVPYIP